MTSEIESTYKELIASLEDAIGIRDQIIASKDRQIVILNEMVELCEKALGARGKEQPAESREESTLEKLENGVY